MSDDKHPSTLLIFGERPPQPFHKRLWSKITSPESLGLLNTGSALLNTVAALVMVIFTAALTVVSVFQWKELQAGKADTQRLLDTFGRQTTALETTANAAKVSAENSTKQVNAMDSSATTANKHLQVTIESYRRQQRAWVGPLDATIAPLAHKTTAISVTLKNTGSTPAFDVQTHMQAAEGLFAIEPSPNDSRLVMFPNGTYSLSLTADTITDSAIKQILGNVMTFYVYGYVKYKDVFGVSHCTQFTYRYDIHRKALVFHSKGNSVT